MRLTAIFALAVVLASGAACLSRTPVPVKVEMPGVSPFPAGLFREIIVADFRNDSPSPDFELGRELQAYLAREIGRPFEGPVSRADVSREAAAAANDPAFWKRAAAGRDGAVFLTGSATLVGQVRKALDIRKLPADGPFNIDRRGFIEQCRWTLTVDLSVISGATGESLYRRTFREERDYLELDKPAEFAFSELADRVRARVLPILFGTPTTEERTLLRR